MCKYSKIQNETGIQNTSSSKPFRLEISNLQVCVYLFVLGHGPKHDKNLLQAQQGNSVVRVLARQVWQYEFNLQNPRKSQMQLLTSILPEFLHRAWRRTENHLKAHIGSKHRNKRGPASSQGEEENSLLNAALHFHTQAISQNNL